MASSWCSTAVVVLDVVVGLGHRGQDGVEPEVVTAVESDQGRLLECRRVVPPLRNPEPSHVLVELQLVGPRIDDHHVVAVGVGEREVRAGVAHAHEDVRNRCAVARRHRSPHHCPHAWQHLDRQRDRRAGSNDDRHRGLDSELVLPPPVLVADRIGMEENPIGAVGYVDELEATVTAGGHRHEVDVGVQHHLGADDWVVIVSPAASPKSSCPPRATTTAAATRVQGRWHAVVVGDGARSSHRRRSGRRSQRRSWWPIRSSRRRPTPLSLRRS